ncbi:hypothetical protein GUJ93_ZPchr0024g29089 [Zizania palustris]|uniref:Uncharacterized protein n=1 Tax=Zizania palustris TaxID=103762 RepID=A0A8J5URK8_ZIZPA|nr:hypothetical protein GUJ93_ZPchr0024g29089 [Zizania palustris]
MHRSQSTGSDRHQTGSGPVWLAGGGQLPLHIPPPLLPIGRYKARHVAPARRGCACARRATVPVPPAGEDFTAARARGRWKIGGGVG